METTVGGAVVAEVTRDNPDFSVVNLNPSTSYRLIITAINERGESKPDHLTVQTLSLHPPRHETSAGIYQLFLFDSLNFFKLIY